MFTIVSRSKTWKPDAPATLANLPFEIITQIASDRLFLRKHWKDLRLVCRSWEQPLAALLFRYISISRLKKDRDSFELIAAHPHLAQHVQYIVWNELNLEVWSRQPDDRGDKFDDFDTINQLLSDAAHDPDLFWLPKEKPSDTNHQEARQNDINAFLSQFAAALDRMPILNTFVSRPMPNDRVFPYKGYPIQANRYSGMFDPGLIGGNDGFFTFMLPILTSQVKPKIDSLRWADERTWMTSLADNLKFEHVHAFSALTSIELCISHYEEDCLSALVLCLSEARELSHLSLCFERTTPHPYRTVVDTMFWQCHWPHLISFQLAYVQLNDAGYGKFFRKHRQRLRYLTLIGCQVTMRELVEMRDSSNLQLDSITIQSDDDESAALVSEKKLLSFMTAASPHIITNDGEVLPSDSERELSTTVSIHDPYACSTAVYFDLKLEPFNSAYEKVDLMEICSNEEEEHRPEASEPWEYYSDWDSDAEEEVVPTLHLAELPGPGSDVSSDQDADSRDGEVILQVGVEYSWLDMIV